VSRLDGSSRKILISRDLDEPRDIALDPVHGWMYWSDWGESARIERAWMDGSHRSVIVSEEVGWPNGIALDVGLQHLYFCDAKQDRIEMVNTDGSGERAKRVRIFCCL
jgi:low density lipoprotein receptor-related protein 5/6